MDVVYVRKKELKSMDQYPKKIHWPNIKNRVNEYICPWLKYFSSISTILTESVL